MTGAQSACGYLYNKFGISGPTGALKLIPGGSGTRITGSSFDYSLGDTYQPTDNLKLDLGLRVENHRYHLPPYGMQADCTFYYIPTSYTPPVNDPNVTFNGYTGAFVNGKPVGPGNCPQATFAPLSKDQTNPTVPEPRVALSYQIGSNNAVRASYGRTARFPEGETSDYAPPPDYGSQFAGPTYMNPAMFAVTGTYNAVMPWLPASPFTSTSASDYYGSHNIAADCGFNGYMVPCTSYQSQLYWTVENGDFGNPVAPLKPVTYSNYDVSFSHQFSHGVSMKLTGWARRGYDLDILESSQLKSSIVNPDGSTHTYQYQIPTNGGLEIADGLEFYLTKERPIGLSAQLSGTYSNVRQNVPGADEYHGLLSPNQANTGLYRVSYVSPLTSTLALSYKTKDGWRLQTRLDYNIGYPYGDGLLTGFTYNGTNINIPHTNANGGQTQFLDPSNPGSYFKPNIAATLGTPETNQANGALSHRNLIAELTIEKKVGHGALGLSINNLFNEAFTGPVNAGGDFGQLGNGPFGYLNSASYFGGTGMHLNGTYQPVATGVSGPLTGYNTGCNPDPSSGVTCLAQGGSINGRGAYINLPNGIGRSYFLYYSVHL